MIRILFLNFSPPFLPFFLSSPLFFFPSFSISPVFLSFPFSFPFPFSLPFFFFFFPFFFFLGRSIYRPREINYNLTRNLKILNKKGYNFPEGFNFFLNFIKASDDFNKVNIGLNFTRFLIL